MALMRNLTVNVENRNKPSEKGILCLILGLGAMALKRYNYFVTL